MLYKITRIFARILFIFVFIKKEGVRHIPAQGPVILAANHLSYWDPIIIGIAINRKINFMAKAQIFNIVVLGTLLKKYSAFPVKRGVPDRGAIRYALYLLEKGEVVGIFPEGTRNLENVDLKAQSGIAMLALKSKAPVIPIACQYGFRMIPFGAKIRVGSPMYLEDYESIKATSQTLQEISSKIMQEINGLLSNK